MSTHPGADTTWSRVELPRPLGYACALAVDQGRYRGARSNVGTDRIASTDVGGRMAVARNRKSEPIGSVIRRARASQHSRPQRRETGQPIRVAIADDSYLIRNAL